MKITNRSELPRRLKRLLVDRCGAAEVANGQRLNFITPFSERPIVLTSAHTLILTSTLAPPKKYYYARIAVSSTVTHLEPRGFTICLTDHKGNGVHKACVQWIAFLPDPSKEVIGNNKYVMGGEAHISFPQLSSTPVIVTNAHAHPTGKNLIGAALISWAICNQPDGFDVRVIDHMGNQPRDAWVTWMAVIPQMGINWFRGEARQMSNLWTIKTNPSFDLDTNLVPRYPAYVLSAEGVIVGAVDPSDDNFTVSLIRPDGSVAKDRLVQWLGYKEI